MGRRETYMDRDVFIALARGFRATKPTDSVKHAQWLRDVSAVAAICKSFNAAFLREKFFADCGLTEKESK